MNQRTVERDWTVSLFSNIGYTAENWEKHGNRKWESLSSSNGGVR